jgi:acyl-CoA-dependent ceramide synthase
MAYAYSPVFVYDSKDILFIVYYVIVWSFVRQFLTIHVLHPIALKFGLRKRAKLDRFGEQGYALIYFSLFGSLGIVSLDFPG